jgi:hypothetical protein
MSLSLCFCFFLKWRGGKYTYLESGLLCGIVFGLILGYDKTVLCELSVLLVLLCSGRNCSLHCTEMRLFRVELSVSFYT